MVDVSGMYIAKINDKVYALRCISIAKEHIKYETKITIKYRELLNSDIYYDSSVNVINPIEYYMSNDEKVRYHSGDLQEYEKYMIYARAIKYEQEKLNKDELDEIMKQDEKLKKILKP